MCAALFQHSTCSDMLLVHMQAPSPVLTHQRSCQRWTRTPLRVSQQVPQQAMQPGAVTIGPSEQLLIRSWGSVLPEHSSTGRSCLGEGWLRRRLALTLATVCIIAGWKVVGRRSCWYHNNMQVLPARQYAGTACQASVCKCCTPYNLRRTWTLVRLFNILIPCNGTTGVTAQLALGAWHGVPNSYAVH